MTPDDINLWWDKSFAHVSLEQYNEANQCYDEIERDPTHLNALDGKGVVQGFRGNFKEAISFFDKALEIDPKNSHILRNKASALEQLGDRASAEEYYNQAISLELGYQ